MSDRRPTRRGVLAAGAATAAAAVAGCGRSGAPSMTAGTAGTSSPTSSPASPSAPAPATGSAPSTAAAPLWAVTVASGESSLLASYDAVVKAHPTLKTPLAPLRAAHVAHLKALKLTRPGKALPGLPTGQAEALSRLAGAEQKASDTTAAICVTCPTEAAALLGSIAAADASHAVVLQSIGSR